MICAPRALMEWGPKHRGKRPCPIGRQQGGRGQASSHISACPQASCKDHYASQMPPCSCQTPPILVSQAHSLLLIAVGPPAIAGSAEKVCRWLWCIECLQASPSGCSHHKSCFCSLSLRATSFRPPSTSGTIPRFVDLWLCHTQARTRV